MKYIVGLVIATAVVGCASLDRRTESKLIPGADSKHWSFETTPLTTYPEDDKDAEKTRMGWLATWMHEASACPGGYRITSRKAVAQKTGLGATVHRIYYSVECT